MAFVLPINQCVMHARQKMLDAAYIRAMQPARASDAEFVLGEARASLQMAAGQGWLGDIEQHIAAFMASDEARF